MPRGPVVASPVPGAVPQNPGDVIQSSVWNATVDDIYNIFNTIQPIEYGGNGVSDGKPLDNSFGVKNSTDQTKVGMFSAANIPTATTRTYTLPATSGTLALTSDIAPQKGYLFGLTLSNNATDPTNDIDIAPGEATSSNIPVGLMTLVSSLTKRLDASWAVGNGSGGLDTGSVAVNATYHVYVIERPDTGVVDALFSASLSPTLPTNYTLYRRIGSIVRESGANVAFVQRGDRFERKSYATVVTSAALGTTPTNFAVGVPSGISVEAELDFFAFKAGAAPEVNVYSPDKSDQTPSLVNGRGFGSGSSTDNGQSSFRIRVQTNTAREVRVVSSLAATTFYLGTSAWYDTRDRS